MIYERFTRHLLLIALIAIIFTPQFSNAQVSVTGAWSGSSFTGGNYYPNTFSLVQNGNKVTGSGIAGTNAPGVITGTVSGNQLTMHSEYPTINYSSDSVATTDGVTMSGTFLDSQGTSGTFSATNANPPFTPNVTIPDPPITQVKGSSVKLTLLKFSSIQQAALRASKSSKTTTQYNITISKGSQRIKLTSKRNTVTVQNLAAGSYKVNYTASAIRNEKRVFSSKKSPTAVFTIRGNK